MSKKQISILIVVLALSMTRLEVRYRRGSQAFRLMLLALALIVPAFAFYPVIFQAAPARRSSGR